MLGLLADITTQMRREEAIRRLVAEKPNVVINAQLMHSFFARADGVPAGLKTPYENLVSLSSSSLRSYERSLRSDAVLKTEPIRAREIDLSLKPTRKMLDARQPDEPSGVPATIVKAIDAWILAADTFEKEALRQDAQQLRAGLKDLSEKAADARDAVRALNRTADLQGRLPWPPMHFNSPLPASSRPGRTCKLSSSNWSACQKSWTR